MSNVIKLTGISIVLIFLAMNSACASAETYFIETPSPIKLGSVEFMPVLISGDGKIVYGEDGAGLASWTKISGLASMVGLPSGFSFLPEAVSYDGSALAGLVTKRRFSPKNFSLFSWSKNRGIDIIQPHFSPSDDLMNSLEISDSGSTLMFMCKNESNNQLPCSSHVAPDQGPFIDETWSQSTGFRRLSGSILKKFNYIKASRNLKVYVAGVIGTSNFGLLKGNGNFTPLQEFPGEFNPDEDKIIMNRSGEFLAINNVIRKETFVWDKDGERMPPFKLPQDCYGFTITDIDDNGAFFGTSYCPSLSRTEEIGLRATFTGIKTIHQWLQDDGLPNHLGPVTFVTIVSANGKTVFGETNMHWAFETQLHDNANLKNDICLVEICSFLAHVQ